MRKFMIMCVKSRRAAGQLSSQAATFYAEGIQKLVPCYDICLSNAGNYVKSSLRYGKSDRNNIF
jgi:hypothetical protein